MSEKEHEKSLAKRRQANVKAVQKRRNKIKSDAVQYKGGKCQICGYDKCVQALEFHHVNPDEKSFAISAKGYTRSWSVVQTELDKCVLLCSNCHKEVEAGITSLP